MTTEPNAILITRIFDPGPVTRACDVAVHRLYRYAEVAAGHDPEALDGTEDRSTWPLRCRAADLLADRLDDLGIWANRRRAERRANRKEWV